MIVSMQMNPISDRVTSATFKIPKLDLMYSMSHVIPSRMFLAWTGSVVGWYGLLAPEIMVLEASPSKPSASPLFLMMPVGRRWTLVEHSYDIKAKKTKNPTLTNRLDPRHERSLCFREHTLFHAGWTRMEETNHTVHFS